MASPPNPYFIYIELLWPDGHRATQNEIARVKATDINGSVLTDEGQSGWNPSTGGWQPIFMQNIAAFAARGMPNLRFDVINTQEVNVYQTVTFNNIASGTTVRIIIGQSATIVGGGTGPTTFTVTGHARRKSDATAFFPGNVYVYDVTNGSEVLLGGTVLGADGAYSVSFTSDSFTNNGGSHVQPNLQVRLADPITAQPLTQSDVFIGWMSGQPIDLTVDDSLPSGQEHKVFGTVRNNLGLPVAGVLIQAVDVVWTTAGLQEIPLGTTISDASGDYSIIYQPPSVTSAPNACAPEPDQINLLVYARQVTVTSPPTSPPTTITLGTAGVIFNAADEQRADIVVNKTAVSVDSEYTSLNNGLAGCFGTTDADRWNTINLLNSRPDLLTFVAQSSGEPEARVQAYVQAWLIAGDINNKVYLPLLSALTSPPASPPAPQLYKLLLPLSAEVMYGLVRDGLGVSLSDLLSVEPDAFFDAIVETIHQGIISASIEPKLRPSTPTAKDSLVDDWRTVLSVMMTRAPGSGELPQWQQRLLTLAFPDTPVAPSVIGTPTVSQIPSDTATAHPVNMPNPVAAGDLLLVLISSHTGVAVTGPGDWTPITSIANGTTVRLTVFGKVALGTESGVAVTFTTSTGANAVAQVLRVGQGTWSGTLQDVFFTTVAGTSATTTVDPPPMSTSFSPSPPSALLLALGAYAGNATSTASNPPAGYGSFVRSGSGTTTPANISSVMSAWRLTMQSGENPGAFNLTAASVWVAATLAVRASAGLQTTKRQAVVAAHFDSQGSFDDLLKLLQQNPLFTASDLENLRFVFEMYDKVGEYYPIVAAVYPSKASRGWKTIADLATVTLAEWVTFAYTQQAYVATSGNTNPPNLFPGDIPGTTTSDKAAVYAQRLFDLFGASSPQTKFVSSFVQSPPNPNLQQIGSFLQANPTYSLESSNIDVFNAAAMASPPTSPVTAPLPDALVPVMKQLQRVYRLTNDFAAAQALVANGYDSAVKISQVEEGAFIASQERFVGGLTAARNIHRTASHYTSEVLFNIVKFHQNVNEAGGLTAVSGAPNLAMAAALSSASVIDPTEGFDPNLGGINKPVPPDPRKLPNWTTLFGNLNSCACKCCQTVLSPGAYLVDILEFATQGPRKPLLDRRPDLEDIQITCSNTNTVLPYIDLVNEMLEGAVTPAPFPLTNAGGVAVTATTLDAAVTSASVFTSQVVPAFAAHGVTLSARATIVNGFDDNPAGTRVWNVTDDASFYSIRGTTTPFTTYVSLVAPRAFSLVKTSSPSFVIDAATLDAAAAAGTPWNDARIPQAFADHGYPLGEDAVLRDSAEDTTANRAWVVEDAAWMFTIKGASPPYTTLPFQQTSDTNDSLEVFPEHTTTAAYDILSTTVFPFNLPLAFGKEQANIFLQAKGVRQHQVLESFTIDDRDTALQKGTGALAFLNLSTTEAQAILAAPSGGPQYWGFDTTAPVEIVRPDQPTQTLRGTWLDLLALVPVFLHRSGLAYQELLDLLDTEFVQLEFTSSESSHIVHISADDEALAECDFNKFQLAHLNDTALGPPTLRRMSFFIRLWRRLGWTMRELDTYLMALEGGVIPNSLTQVSLVKRLIEQLGVEPRQVFAFWSDLETRRTGRNPRSLYDEVFLVGTPGQAELADLEQVARGATNIPISGTAPANVGEDLKGHVRAALRLKAAEIDLLWPASGFVTVPMLSQIYRIAVLCHAIGISVVDYFDFIATTGTDPLPANPTGTLPARIIAVYDGVVDIGRVQSTSMSAGEIQYYLTDFAEAGDPFVAKREDLNAAAQRLILGVGDIAGALPANPHPDAAALSQLLAKVMPSDKVVRAVTIITPARDANGAFASPPVPPTTADLDFLRRYFTVFVPTPPGIEAFLGTLFSEPDGPTRYSLVFDTLNAFLIDQAQTNTALSVTSELFGIDRDTADILLTESLSSTHGRPSAIDDWKALLNGGWDTGDPTIEGLGPLPGAPPGPPLVWNGVIVVPRGGVFRFVVEIDAAGASATDFTFKIDDGTPAFAAGLPQHPTPVQPTSPPTFGSEFVYDPVTLKGGAVLNATLTYSGTSKISLFWRIDNADAVIIPATVVLPMTISAPLKAAPPNASPPAAQLPPVRPSEYLKMFKATRTAAGLSLTRAELRYLVQVQSLPASPPDPQVLAFSLDRLPVLATDPDIRWADFAKVIDLLGLNRSIPFKDKTLFELWNDLPNPTVADVANQTGWKTEDIVAVQSLWSTASPPQAVPSFRDPAIWYVLRATMDIVSRLDLRAQRILDFLVRTEPTAQSSIALRNTFRSQFTRAEWKDVFKPLMDPLRQKQRDALVGFLTTRPILYRGTTRNFFDANDLYAFFLLDVQMETDTLISRMVLAHLVIQLFIDRVFLGLEDSAAFTSIDDAKDQWSWMQRFRVWEANRKVFLFPENYIEPELRDDKTEFFQELEDELLQGTVTDDTGNTALANYLDKMNEVSNLEVVGSYAEGGSLGVNGVLHVVGRTRSEPRTFYYRTFIAKQAAEGVWNPWTKIPVEIKADVVVPVVFNGHLHLYWPTITVKHRPDPPKKDDGSPANVNNDNVADEHHTTYAAEIKIISTEYVPSQKKWLKPLVSTARAIDEDAPSPFENELGEILPATDNYHFRVSAVGKEYVSLQLIKTHTPEPPTEVKVTIRVPGIRFPGFLGRGFQLFPTTRDVIIQIPHDQVSPALLGTFQFWYTGENTFEPTGDEGSIALTLGKNWPVNTALKHNGAEQVDIAVEGQTIKNELELKTNLPFFQNTPYPFRVFDTNFGYIGEENLPFFYETSRESLFAFNKGAVTAAGLNKTNILTASFSTFNHPLVRQLQQTLHDFGTPALMNRLTEALPLVDDRYYANYYYNYYGNLYLGYHIAGDNQALGTIERLFEAEFDPRETVVGPAARPTNEFGYGTPFGIYNWELFFHLPMLVAERLKQNLDFETAMKWYHYVFDPKQSLNTYEQTKRFVGALPPGARFWTFLPFFANKDVTDSLLDTLGLKKTLSADERVQLAQLIDDWRHNPFKPHLIARQRTAAYQKFVVMKYLDNLISWGDTLFRQDSFESINQATQLYVLADGILGQKPQEIDSLAKPQKLTFRELAAKGLDEFQNAIVEVEYQIVTNQDYLKSNVLAPQNSSAVPIRNIALKSFFFMIPRNDSLDGFWDTVQDRLFKIRNSMNIDGVKRQLALFQPPINPALLVAAAAAGLDLSSVIAQLNTPLPHYRYTIWIQKAVDLCNELKSFGAAMLAAMEKRDAEALQLLRQNHEIKLLQLVRKVKEQQVREAEGNITAIELSKAIAEDRRDEYHNREKINSSEQQQNSSTKTASVLETFAGGIHSLAAAFSVIPDSGAGIVGPFPMIHAELKIGSALLNAANAISAGLSTIAGVFRNNATLAGFQASYERRWEDWKLQERQATKEITQLNQQIAVANIRLQIAQQELDNQDTQIDQSKEVLDFQKSKFTNKDLYVFMVTQLSRTFQQVYQLAFDAAKTAERTLQFELGVEDTYVQFTYQDSLHQGLLAGEKLIQDLKRMEVGYLERYKREYEIQKPISLAFIDGQALQDLREKGVCEFVLPEILFDLDFPGQYFRRIKAVRLTIPCVTGPHTSISAKLTLLSSNFRKDAKAPDPKKYPYTGPDDPRFVQDPVGIQAIATSTGQSDAGLFELNFRDERYLPFEGAGAISHWRLELPTVARQFDYLTISDVVVQLSYTAREGGGQLKTAAETFIDQRLNQMLNILATSDASMVRAFSLRREFPDAFHKLLATPLSPPVPTVMTIVPEHFPYVIRQQNFKMTAGTVTVHINPKLGKTIPAQTTVSVTDNTGTPLETQLLVPGFLPQDLHLQQVSKQANQPVTPLVLDDVEDIVVIINYTVKP